MRTFIVTVFLIVCLVSYNNHVLAQTVLFSDDFSTPDSESAYTMLEAGPAFDPDLGLRHEFAFGPNPDTFFDGDYGFFGLPPAPNTTDDSTMGLWTYVNIEGASADGINFFTVDDFSGNIRVTVDVFMRFGGSGSTEYMGLGVYCSGDLFNNFEQALDGSDPLGEGGDGYVFWMNTDGDCADCDYLITEYTPGVSIQPGDSDPNPDTGFPGDPFFYECGTWEFENPEFNTLCLLDSLVDPFFATIYPAEGRLGHAAGNIEGSPANDWTTVTMEHVDGTISVYLDGTLVHTYTDPDTTYTSGKIMLAWEDPFNSTGAEQMGWFDNLLIEQLDADTDVNNWNLLD